MVLSLLLRTGLAGLVLAAAAVSRGASPSASIVGRVELVGDPPAGPRRPRVAALGMTPPVDEADRRRAVVYLEEAPRPAEDDAQPARAILDQRNQEFVPHVMAVTVGTTVDFLNSDGMFHNVFSLSKAKRFDLGRYPRGQKKSIRFDRPGVVRVFCDMHSHMSAYILVFAHRYFAMTEADGRFRIEDVPAGTYTIVAWIEGEARASRQVQVPPLGSVEVGLQIR